MSLEKALSLTTMAFLMFIFCKTLFRCLVSPVLAYRKLKRNGFGGPTPIFPLGNINEMNNNNSNQKCCSFGSAEITHNIHSTVSPYYARWQNAHGKVFTYWVGTEPFVYVADPEYVKIMSEEVKAKNWGKPSVFRNDRESLFGNGLVMAEGHQWVRQRHLVTPAFNPSNLKTMASLMVESGKQMLDRWATLISSGDQEIDVEREITATAGEIIAKSSFGIDHQNGKEVFEKLRALQITLFKTHRFVGVPFGKFLSARQTLEAMKIGKEIDELFLSIIRARKNAVVSQNQQDLLSLLLKANREEEKLGRTLTTEELVNECKTFFFAGHETTALALTWTLLLLAINSEWQTQLREEIRQVLGNKESDFDFTKIVALKKMGWVMSEVLRLYPPAPNVQRQARGDIKVKNQTIPKGTNIWVDIVAMHHDGALWGDDVNEFRPKRFEKDSIYGGCKHKMGYLPFGFGGRMCVGRNLTFMEYKIVLTLILSRFSFSPSPSYRHSPSMMLSLRPDHGLPLIFRSLQA